MGITVVDLINARRNLFVELSALGLPVGEGINLTYRPNYLNIDTEVEFQEAAKDPRLTEPLYKQFILVVSDWDLLDVNKRKPIDLTIQGLQANKVPGRVIGYLFAKIWEDFRLAETNARDSISGTNPAESSAPHPNGTTG